MPYTPPAANAVNFELKPYTAPAPGAVNFTLDDPVIVEPPVDPPASTQRRGGIVQIYRRDDDEDDDKRRLAPFAYQIREAEEEAARLSAEHAKATSADRRAMRSLAR